MHAPETRAYVCILGYLGNKSETERNLINYYLVTRESIRVGDSIPEVPDSRASSAIYRAHVVSISV